MRVFVLLIFVLMTAPVSAQSQNDRIDMIAMSGLMGRLCSTMNVNTDAARALLETVKLSQDQMFARSQIAVERAEKALSGASESAICETANRMFGKAGETYPGLMQHN